MKSKPSLKSLAKRALLPLSLLCFLTSVVGCSSSTTPTYSKENIPESLQDICKNEYGVDVKVRLVGETLWVYVPLEDIFIPAKKPEKYSEKFEVEKNLILFKDGAFKVEHLIKVIPVQEKYQEFDYDKAAAEKVSKVMRAIRRVAFSMPHATKNEPKIFCLIIADIKNGFKIEQTFYLLDLKKASYEFISWGEYLHRSIQDTALAPRLVADKEGSSLEYTDISFDDFIRRQIQYRIQLKFSKPEVEQTVDIDKEILKIVITTLKAYEFKDFQEVELNNLLTNNKIILNRAAVWTRSTDEKR